MKKEILGHFDKCHMEEILSDKTLLASLLMDGEVARSISIDMDGTITIERTRCRWLNWLFRDRRRISFLDFAFKVSNALSGQQNNRNEIIFDGIVDVIKDMNRNGHMRENDIRYVVDALYDTMRLGWNGERKSTYTEVRSQSGNRHKDKRRDEFDVGHGRILLNSGESFGPTITILKQK